MEMLVERLFDTYGKSVLRDSICVCDQEIAAFLKDFPLDDGQRLDIYDKIKLLDLQRSADAFAVGLHLGLSLYNDVCRFGPKEDE